MNQNDQIVIELPFPLPTWNALLSMTLRDRMKCKKIIYNLTYLSIALEKDYATWTETQSNLRLTQLSAIREQYLRMIRPKTSDQLLTRKNRATTKKRY